MSSADSFYKGKRVLVTGGAGFIGSELVRQLAGLGASVIVIDNLINGKKENLRGCDEPGVRLFVEDIRNESLLRELLPGADLVFHLACLGVRHSIHAPMENHEVNAAGTLKLLILSRQAEVRRFVYVSSSEVYGTARFAPMTEDHPTVPTTVYGASKLAGECYTRAFYETYAYPATVVRPFNTYGPRCHHEGDSGEVIPKFLLRAWAGRSPVVFGDGSQTRDFTYVSDTARGILAAGACDQTIGQTLNLGSGKETAIKDLALLCTGLVGRRDLAVTYDEPRPGDILRLCADTAKARRLLGFSPEISLEAGLVKLRDWYASSGRSPEECLEEEIVHNWEASSVGLHKK